MTERNIRLIIEYDGFCYSGWQVQDGQETIQGKMIEAISRVTGKDVTLYAAGRTDAGVHALGQVANFRIDHHLEPERFKDAINYYLPDAILVKRSEESESRFHSRFDAKWRRYRYLLSPTCSALHKNRRWEGVGELDLRLLRESAKLIEGEHDFSPFCVVASQKEDKRCQIYHSEWRLVGDLYVFEIRGNRFLHSMVRSLVGGMVNLALLKQDQNRRNLTLDAFRDMLTAPATERNQFTAPAHGLYLVAVAYNNS